MKSVLDTLFSRPVLVAAGLVAANALIWFLGPLLAIAGIRPLEGELARWVAITVCAVAAAVYVAGRSARQEQRNRRLLDGLVAGEAAAKPGPSAPGARDLAVISKRFEEAIAVLRRNRLGGKRRLLDALAGRRFVYQLPWYVIIGAPGAGKTTALANSGLDFPLANKLGKRGVRGIGGTRNCDWWFTGEAVLIDTAGRLTTQDSDHAADQAAWFGFLDLLRQHRPRQPINGVLLTVSVSDLLAATREEQRQHARRLRERIDELHGRLGAGIPVYVLVTKLDLLAGFVEFFADFDKDERAQVWGVTFPYQAGASAVDPLVRMPSELVALEKRLDERLIERLNGESDRDRRAAIYAFPQQWRVMRETLVEFLQTTFADAAAAAQRPLVRGVYFTSATQEGTPMDRALGGLARALGLSSRIVAPARPTGKSFFVTRLLREVVFAEAGLVGTDLRWRKQRVLLEWGVLAATVAAVVVALALLWRAYASNADYLDMVKAALGPIERDVTSAVASPPTDLPALLPVLDGVQAIGAMGEGPAQATAPLRWPLGLDQRPRIEAAGRDAYLRLLREAFLPRVAVRLEARLRAGAQEHVETLHEALKAYLMLFGGQNFDRRALATFLRADWDLTLPATAGTDATTALRRHFDRLVASGEVGAPTLADQQLIEQTRSIVGSVPLAQRAYIRLQSLDAQASPALGAPDFTVEAIAGPAAKQVFVRDSGRSLAQGVPRLYSRAVRQQLPGLSEEVLRQLAAESTWVLGSAFEPLDAKSTERLLVEIEQRYQAEYLKHWDEFLRDLRIARGADLAQSAEVVQVLARTDSPLLALVTTVVQEGPIDGAAAGAARSRAVGEPAALPERFDALQRLATDQRASLQEALDLLGKLSTYLAAVDDALKRKTAVPSSDVGRELASLASRLPEPLHSMLAQLASRSVGQVFVARRDDLSRQLAGEVGAPCNRLVNGRYPFARTGSEEISRADFARTFAAGGLIDGFFRRELAPYVDMNTRNWTLPTADGGAEAADVLLPFQRAQQIRSAMFADGGRRLGVRLEFKLLELDAGVTSFEIDIDGQPLRFARDTRSALTARWPDGDAGVQRVQIAVTTGAAGGPRYAFEGPWGLLRLFERVRVEPQSTADRMLVVFDVEGRRARFEIKSATGANPLRLAALEQFQCPQKL